MELKHIELARLIVSPANMRGKGKAPDIDNILPSVRARGILVPLIVRAAADDEGHFEIVAGRRRYHAALYDALAGALLLLALLRRPELAQATIPWLLQMSTADGEQRDALQQGTLF